MFGQNNYIEESESWSQDFTVSGTAANVDWLLGANYFSEKMHGEVKVPLTNLGLVFGLPADFFNTATTGRTATSTSRPTACSCRAGTRSPTRSP